MRLNEGIITPRTFELKDFYTRVLNFSVASENDYFVLMHTWGQTAQHPVFQSAFVGKSQYFTLEVADVDEEYCRIKSMNVPIATTLRDEPWGDRHFTVTDPQGIGIDIVTYRQPLG